jgi:sec-independent protein translocase protein TatA
MPGVPELLVILAIVFLIFGAAKLPQLARSLGKARSEFQAGVKEGGKEHEEGDPIGPPQKTNQDKTSDGAQS